MLTQHCVTMFILQDTHCSSRSILSEYVVQNTYISIFKIIVTYLMILIFNKKKDK